MKRPWIPEREVPTSLATSLLETQFPSLAPVSLRVIGAGWDNIVYLANERLVFRFPVRHIGVALLDAEIRLLPAIAGRLPIPISAPTHVGKPAGDYPWPFAGYPFIPGRTPADVGPDDDARARAARPLGEFLRALHAIPVSEARTLGVPEDTMERLDVPSRVTMMRERAGAHPDLRRFVDAAEALQPRNGIASALVHGDLHCWQMLVADDGRLTGIIDWGDTHVGDPAIDLSIAFCYLPPAARAAFRDAYGPIPVDTWTLARFRAVHISIALLAYARDIGNAALAKESQLGLEYAIQ